MAPGGVDRGSGVRPLAPLAHCEGVAVGPTGAIYAGDETGGLHRVDLATGAHEQVADVGGFAVGLCVDGDGLVYVCVYDGGRIVRADPETGAVETYCDSVEGGPLPAPNWNLFTPDGTMVVSDSCADPAGLGFLEERSGRVVAVPPGGGGASVVPTPPLDYPNGMALAPDGTLYVVETFLEPRVVAIRGGAVSVVADLPHTVPDGLALDEEGGLLVSMFQPNLIVRLPPGGGEPETVASDWTGQRLLTPTNIAFCGDDRRTLAIASLCGWSLSVLETPWRGLPLNYPRVMPPGARRSGRSGTAPGPGRS
jgi:sugar lactone lactonase YvrE